MVDRRVQTRSTGKGYPGTDPVSPPIDEWRKERSVRQSGGVPDKTGEDHTRRIEDLEAQHPHKPEDFLEANVLGGWFWFDYLVDSNWSGEEGKLVTTASGNTFRMFSNFDGANGALQHAVGTDANRSILVYQDVTLSATEDLALAIDQIIFVQGLPWPPLTKAGIDPLGGKHVTDITGPASGPIFSISSGGLDSGIFFRWIGFRPGHSLQTVVRVDNGASQPDTVRFSDCSFNSLGTNTLDRLLSNNGNSMNSVILLIERCQGEITDFYNPTGSGNSPQRLLAYDNYLTMTTFWSNGGQTSASANPAGWDIRGGAYRFTTTRIFAAMPSGGPQVANIGDMHIIFTGSGAVFQTNTGSIGQAHLRFTNIDVEFENSGGYFGNFPDMTLGTGDGLFIDNVFGHNVSVAPNNANPFVNVGLNDWTDVWVGDIWGEDFATHYTGPTLTPPLSPAFDHGTLVGLGDDDHTIYALLAGRSGGQTLIGGTGASNNLTLESTSNATKGFIIVPAGTNIGMPTGLSNMRMVVDREGTSANIRFRGSTGNTRYRSDWNMSDADGLSVNAFDDTGSVYLPFKFEAESFTFDWRATADSALTIFDSGTSTILRLWANNPAARYRSDFNRSTSDLSINVFDQIGGVFQPLNLDALSLTFRLSGSSAEGFVCDGNGDLRLLGYSRFGSLSAPTNTVDGDVTTVRLFVGDATAVTGVEALITGDFTVTSTAMIGAALAASATAHVQQATLGNEVFRVESVATNDDPSERVFQNRAATTDATVTTLHTVTIPASTTVHVEARVIARRTGGTAGTAEDAAGYIIQGTFKNVAGAATLVGATTIDHVAEDQPAWDAALTASGATVLVRVTGAANNNITWHCTVRTWQVGS